MKSRMALKVAVIIVSSILFPSWAILSGAEIKDPDLEKAIRISGLRGQIQSMPAAFVMTIPADMFSDNQERSRFYSRIKDKVTSESLLEIVQETFSKNIDKENLKQVLQFYQSGLGRRIGHLQSEALSPYAIKTIREGRRFTASLDSNRLMLLERLIDGLNTDRNNIIFRRLIVRLIGITACKQPSVPEGYVDARLKLLEKSFENDYASLREITLNCFSNTFRSLSNAELEALIKFHESQEGTWFQTTVSKAFEKIITETIRSIEQELGNSRADVPAR